MDDILTYLNFSIEKLCIKDLSRNGHLKKILNEQVNYVINDQTRSTDPQN